MQLFTTESMIRKVIYIYEPKRTKRGEY